MRDLKQAIRPEAQFFRLRTGRGRINKQPAVNGSVVIIIVVLFIVLPLRNLHYGGAGNDYVKYMSALDSYHKYGYSIFRPGDYLDIYHLVKAHTGSSEPYFWSLAFLIRDLGVPTNYVYPTLFTFTIIFLQIFFRPRNRAYSPTFPMLVVIGSLLSANLTGNYVRQGLATLYIVYLIANIAERDGRITERAMLLAGLAVLNHFAAGLVVLVLGTATLLIGGSYHPVSKKARIKIALYAFLVLVVYFFASGSDQLKDIYYKIEIYSQPNLEMERNNLFVFYMLLLFIVSLMLINKQSLRQRSVSTRIFRVFHIIWLLLCFTVVLVGSAAITRIPLWGVVLAYCQLFPVINLRKRGEKLLLFVGGIVVFLVVHFYRIPGFFLF